MPKTPKYQRYNWWPITATVGLTTATLIGMELLFGGGNEHGVSYSPGIDTMPSYSAGPMVEAHTDAPSLPPKATAVAAWVCRDFVFVDAEHHEVIVNPAIEPDAQRPLNLVNIEAGTINFSQPQSRDNFTLYVHKNGQWRVDGDGRLNRCYGGDAVTATEVYDAQGQDRYVLTDSGSSIHASDRVATDPLTAVRDGLVHADYDNLSDAQIQQFVDDLLTS